MKQSTVLACGCLVLKSLWHLFGKWRKSNFWKYYIILSRFYLPSKTEFNCSTEINKLGCKATTCLQNRKQKKQKTWMDISLKRSYRWLIDIWKDVQNHWLLESCKLKLQSDVTSHWSEWLSSKYPQDTNAGEGVERREAPCIQWECKLVQHYQIWRRKWQPTPAVLPGDSHGQRSLAGHGP